MLFDDFITLLQEFQNHKDNFLSVVNRKSI